MASRQKLVSGCFSTTRKPPDWHGKLVGYEERNRRRDRKSGYTGVAAHLEKLFRKEGAPLFLKRDNGSAFNNQEVDTVLARWGVIPLNSPAYYPRYNGAIEKGIRELKTRLSGILNVPERWDIAQVGAFVSVAAEQENYKPRRSLGGLSAKEVYRKKKENGRWSQRQRHEVLA